MSPDLQELVNKIVQFRDERDWEQFHTLKNLTSALSIEAAELLELSLWKKDDQLERDMIDDECRASVSHEIADVFIYLLLICEKTGIDPVAAALEKISLNAKRYPTSKSKGVATKYTDFD